MRLQSDSNSNHFFPAGAPLRRNSASIRKRTLQTAIAIIGALFIGALFFAPVVFSSTAVAQDEIPNTQKLDIPFTEPADALAGFDLPAGFNATLFAAEPDVHQPIAVTTDARGRLWVAECYTYSDRQQNYDVSLNDRIVIFEDSDNDGEFDKRTVFWDEGKKLTGIEVGLGGVWVTCAPEFLFIPDRNQDDVPDGEPEVLLNGFEDNVIRHNIVNGLRWGPDGWLYGRHGIQATSFVGAPDAADSQRFPMNCAIWRFHPTAKKFEIVAEGGTNPWGFDYDKHGEMFMINTVIGHLFHIVPGARYRRMYGSHFNPYTYQIIEQTADHFHWDQGEEHWAVTKKDGMSGGTDAAGGGHAHTGLMIYQGNNWPAEFDNALVTANFHGRRLNVDTVHREGNSYVGRHSPDILKTTDPWFRGVEMIYGPDGGVFVLDWSDIGECHENDGIHRTSGRIFKFVHGTPNPILAKNLSKLSDDELIEMFDADEWYARKARRILQERSIGGNEQIGTKLVTRFANLKGSKDPIRLKLRIMWALYSAGAASEDWLLKRTEHPDEHIRSWAVRLLADGLREISPTVAARFLSLAKQDESGLVRLYLASSLKRFDDQQRFDIASALCQHVSDATDRVQPHMIWFGIEPSVLASPEVAIDLATQSKIPLVRENIVRRLTEEIESNPAANRFAGWLADENFNASSKLEVLRGMAAALKGWVKAPAPENWPTASKQLAQSPDKTVQSLAQQLDVVFGSGRVMDELKKLVVNKAADVSARTKAIDLLGDNLEPAELFSILKPLLNDKSVTTQVAKSLVHCDTPDAAKILLNRLPNMTPSGKSAAINTLVARETWASKLLAAVKNERVPSSSISAWHARQIKNFGNDELNQQLADAWGEVRNTSQQKLEQIANVRKLVSDSADKASSQNGKVLYEKHCASCHTIFGSGGKIGPDLTGSDRKNLAYLLENLVDPSASVAESYRASVFQLEDGRLLTGVVTEENERTLKLQTKDELLALDKTTIENRRLTNLSLMPDGLLDTLQESEIVDLFGFLQTGTKK